MRKTYKAKCFKCGWIGDWSDLNKDYCDGGYRGEPHETCPNCGDDDIGEVIECRSCGGCFEDVYGSNGLEICEDCLNKLINTRTVAEYGEEHPEDVEISGLWAKVYTQDEINQILMADFMKLPDSKQYEYCKMYVDDDPHEFADWVQTEE